MTKFISLPVLALLFLVFLFFSSLFFPKRSLFVTPDFGLSDLLHFNYPLHEFFSRELKKGHFPLWTSLVGTGYPLFAESQEGFFSLIKIFTAYFFPPVVGFNLLYLVSFSMMAVFTYGFTRLLGLSRSASFLAAFVFTFSGVNITHIAHTNQILTHAFIPLQFYLLEKFFKTRKSYWLAFLSLAVGQALVAGKIQVEIYALLGLVLFFVFRFLQSRLPIASRFRFLFLPLVISIVLGFGLSLVQFLPSYELTRQSTREGGLSQADLLNFPYPPRHLLSFLNPYWFGDPRIGTYPGYNENWGLFWENTAYVGLIPLILAALAVGVTSFSLLHNRLKSVIPENAGGVTKFISFNHPSGERNPHPTGVGTGNRLKSVIPNSGNRLKSVIPENAGGVTHFSALRHTSEVFKDFTSEVKDRGEMVIPVVGFFVFLAVFSLLLAMGKYTPLFILFKLPPLSYFRVPSRFLVLTAFPLSLLAGFGFETLKTFAKGKFFNLSSSLITSLVILLTTVDLFSFGYNYNPRGEARRWLSEPAVASFLRSKGREGSYNFRVFDVGSIKAWNEIFMVRGWQDDLDRYPPLLNSLLPLSNLPSRLPASWAYAGLHTQRWEKSFELVRELIKKDSSGRWSIPEEGLKTLGLQNVKYLVSPFVLEDSQLKLVFRTDFGPAAVNFSVFENPLFLPRARAVSSYVLPPKELGPVSDFSVLKAVLVHPQFDPRRGVLLEEEPDFKDFSPVDGSEVKIVSDTGEEVVITANFTGNGFLVLADSYYPGWEAFVDGRRTKIYPANLNQRAIVVKEGNHLVRFVYQPESFRWGLIFTAASLAAVLGWLGLSFRLESGQNGSRIKCGMTGRAIS